MKIYLIINQRHTTYTLLYLRKAERLLIRLARMLSYSRAPCRCFAATVIRSECAEARTTELRDVGRGKLWIVWPRPNGVGARTDSEDDHRDARSRRSQQI